MSELIVTKNSKQRREKLKEIILSLHEGISFDDAVAEFEKHFDSVSTKEISQMEQELLKEGITINQIQNLCDVHAKVFGGSISDIHTIEDAVSELGHPIQVFMEENERIEKLIEEEINPYLNVSGPTPILMLRIGYERLMEIDKHYERKENLLFPKLERLGITAPPQVMWAVDDEIREEMKEILSILNSKQPNEEDLWEKIKINTTRIIDMIFKENNILFPLMIENMTYFDWILVDASSKEIGYFLEEPKHKWILKDDIEEKEEEIEEGTVLFDAGQLTFEETNALLNVLPLDMTFVDKEGHVKYFSQGKTRIFHRPLTVLGRHVSMCHPPQSVDVVEKVVKRLKSGEKDVEEFWINMGDMFVLIKFFAVRNKNGEYLGILEVAQDVKEIRELKGEKRLLDK